MAQVATGLQVAQRMIWEQVIALPFLVGAGMFYWLLFRTRLVPRWLSVWGLASIPLYAGAAFARWRVPTRRCWPHRNPGMALRRVG
jgi:hypothetical protein